MKPGSKRYRRLAQAKAKARRKAAARQRDILHKVSRAVVDYAVETNAKEIVIGDVRDIADGVNKGKRFNQKISLWPHGKLRSYIAYKALMQGMETVLENEATRVKHVLVVANEKSPKAVCIAVAGVASWDIGMWWEPPIFSPGVCMGNLAES